MNKTAGVFGSIWGVVALIFSLFLFLTLFAPGAVQSSSLAPFGSSVFAYYDGSSFSAEAWAIAGGAFGLAALGLIGAGLVRQRHIFAGILLLISDIGMLVVCFQPFLSGDAGLLGKLPNVLENMAPIAGFVLLVTLLVTVLGFLGSLFSLAAKPKLSKQAAPAEAAKPSTQPAVQPDAKPQPVEEAQTAKPVENPQLVEKPKPMQPAVEGPAVEVPPAQTVQPEAHETAAATQESLPAQPEKPKDE